MDSRPSLYILDSFSRIYQLFHAIPLMTSPTGTPVNVAFGLFRDLLNLARVRKPDYFAAAFDGSGPVFRSEIFAEYKTNRGPMPDDLRPQIALARRVFEAFRVPILMHEGAEADDVIATLAMRGVERGMDVTIVTSDKDARQLLSDRVRILNLRDNKFLDVDGLKADWGVSPAQVVDFLALTGDSVDNVPGIPGIGPKTATKLLGQFGDLETLLARSDEVSGKKMAENLKTHAEIARRARTLVALKTDLPLELDWEALRSDGYDPKALKAICFDCGFKGFLNEIVETAAPPRNRSGTPRRMNP